MTLIIIIRDVRPTPPRRFLDCDYDDDVDDDHHDDDIDDDDDDDHDHRHAVLVHHHHPSHVLAHLDPLQHLIMWVTIILKLSNFQTFST